VVPPGVTKAVARAGMTITLASNICQGHGGGRRGVSFEDSAEYDFADDDRNLYGEGQYPLHRAFRDAEYEAHQNSMFHPDGAPPTSNDSRGSMPHLKLHGTSNKARDYTQL